MLPRVDILLYMMFIVRHPFPDVWDKLAINNSSASCVVEMWAKAPNGVGTLSVGNHSINLGPNHLDKLPSAVVGGRVGPGIRGYQSKEKVVGGLH